MSRYIITLSAVLLLGCYDTEPACEPECEPNEMQCNGSQVELCDPDGCWFVVQDCGEVGAGFACAYVEDSDVYACLPEE